MPPFERDRFFLGFIASFGVLLVLVGLWEWRVTGAFHEIILGTATVGLTGIAVWLARRRQYDESSDDGTAAG